MLTTNASKGLGKVKGSTQAPLYYSFIFVLYFIVITMKVLIVKYQVELQRDLSHYLLLKAMFNGTLVMNSTHGMTN